MKFYRDNGANAFDMPQFKKRWASFAVYTRLLQDGVMKRAEDVRGTNTTKLYKGEKIIDALSRGDQLQQEDLDYEGTETT